MSLSNPCLSQIWVCTPESQSSAIKAPPYNHPVILCFYANNGICQAKLANNSCFRGRREI